MTRTRKGGRMPFAPVLADMVSGRDRVSGGRAGRSAPPAQYICSDGPGPRSPRQIRMGCAVIQRGRSTSAPMSGGCERPTRGAMCPGTAGLSAAVPIKLSDGATAGNNQMEPGKGERATRHWKRAGGAVGQRSRAATRTVCLHCASAHGPRLIPARSRCGLQRKRRCKKQCCLEPAFLRLGCNSAAHMPPSDKCARPRSRFRPSSA